ncbi:MAG: PorT family protein [Salinivirgaceae bacterium]|nr:PorT family protein [Salinivirgaceae bacterium]
MKQLLLLALLLPIFVTAQDFGARATVGLVASQIDGDKMNGFHKLGYVVGADVNRRFSKSWGGQIGLRVIQKGSASTDEQSFYKAKLNYAEMPVCATFHLKQMVFEGGLTAGVLVHSLEDVEGYGYAQPAYSFAKFELGSIVGISYRLLQNIDVTAQFAYSLSRIRPYTSAHSAYMDGGEHNNLLTFAVSYVFADSKILKH